MRVSFILLLILALAAFLRLYKLPEMVPFGFDQEYAANFAYSVKEYPIRLIGQPLSVEGLFMGPLYFYFLTPFFFATNLHPLGGFIGSIVLGLVTILAYFFVIKEVFGTKAALLASFLRGILFIKILDDWGMTPAFTSDLIVLLTLFCFYKYWHGNLKYLIPLGFIFGFYTSFHPIHFPFYLVFLIILLVKKKIPDIKTTLTSIIAFIIPIVPLIIFEILRKFYDVSTLIGLLSGGAQGREGKDISFFLKFLTTDLFKTFRLDFINGDLSVILLALILSFLVWKKIGFWKDKFHITFFGLSFIIFLIYYTVIYPGHVPEYYFLAVTTLGFIYAVATLSLLFSKRSLATVLIVFLIYLTFLNIRDLVYRWNDQNSGSLFHRENIVKEILRRQPKEQEFYVSYIKLLGWNFGFDYFFKLSGQIPQTREAKPPVYTIVVPKSLVDEKELDYSSGNIGLIVQEKF